MNRKREPLQHREARQLGLYRVGQAASASGVTAKMIRHYETVGLLKSARRSSGNYRLYDEAEVHTLRFIRRARTLGFSVMQIAELLSLWRNRSRSSANVRRVAMAHAAELERKVQELQAMARTLTHLAQSCHGDDRPECPILDDLARVEHEPEKRS